MDFHEQIAFQMAKERIEDAVRTAQRMHAIRSARVRLGSALVRLGHWMMGHA
jgi:hypothetical protein